MAPFYEQQPVAEEVSRNSCTFQQKSTTASVITTNSDENEPTRGFVYNKTLAKPLQGAKLSET